MKQRQTTIEIISPRRRSRLRVHNNLFHYSESGGREIDRYCVYCCLTDFFFFIFKVYFYDDRRPHGVSQLAPENERKMNSHFIVAGCCCCTRETCNFRRFLFNSQFHVSLPFNFCTRIAWTIIPTGMHLYLGHTEHHSNLWIINANFERSFSESRLVVQCATQRRGAENAN